ncbi:hypothetical protein A5881_000515 [Enterococcus termitis]|nr:hypothetical protein A5881_000722 [Enterococcus termitis]
MNLLEEKRILMKLIVELIHEKKSITNLYEAIEKRLNRINEIENIISKGQSCTKTIISKKEIDYAKFNDQKIKPSSIPYDIISKDICYILKSSGIPMNGTQIYSELTKNLHFNLSYKNLVNNILPKMINDNNLPVEKVYRGFWQYRHSKKTYR